MKIIQVIKEKINLLELQERKEKILKEIEVCLDEKNIDHYRQCKPGWGNVITFYLNDKLVFSNNISMGDMEIYYYDNCYSCHIAI